MTKYLPDQSRIERSFPVVINGVLTQLTEGTNFTDSASLLSALDGAGITYSAQKYDATTGTASGRIRINGTGSIVTVGVNGTFTSFAVNDWFTPTAAQLEALQRAGNLVLEAEYATAVLTAGPELWPQPAFNASTGLALTHCSVTGGQLLFDNSGIAASCIGTLSGGAIAQGDQVQYSVDVITMPAGEALSINFGGGSASVTSINSTGTKTGTVTLSGAVTVQTVRFSPAVNDSGVVTLDNVSVKKLS